MLLVATGSPFAESKLFCESKEAGTLTINMIAEKRIGNLKLFILLNFKLQSTHWNSQNNGLPGRVAPIIIAYFIKMTSVRNGALFPITIPKM
jgi:hypothetical protein